jgi:hypothetical protein
LLAYVIIAIELAILYTVFWYVFLREPQPYKIKGNPWGGYSGSDGHPGTGNHSHSPAFVSPQTNFPQTNKNISGCEANRNAIYQEWNVAEVKSGAGPTQEMSFPRQQDVLAQHMHSELIRSQHMGVEKSDADKSQRSSTFAAQFLAKLGESLNLINVKIP